MLSNFWKRLSLKRLNIFRYNHTKLILLRNMCHFGKVYTHYN
eukprot:gene16268-22556_t